MRFSILLISIFSALCCQSFAQTENAELKRMVDAEIAFAKTSSEQGTKSAFLAFLANDAIVFNPAPTNGKEFWQKRAASPSILAWQPKFADISATGGLGYTTGDWQYSAKQSDPPSDFGTYFTLWKKQPDGEWKAVLDLGISHEKPASTETGWKTVTAPTKTLAEKTGAETIFKFDEDFSRISETGGVNQAYKKFLAEDSRLLRDNNFPFSGKKLILQETVKLNEKTVWRPRKSFVSSNLAYTYGDYETPATKNKPAVSGYYVHVWKFDGKNWRIVLDVANSAK